QGFDLYNFFFSSVLSVTKMNAEQKMSQVFQEINQIIVKPLDEIYAD
ncbi:hypothetical protein ACQKHK_11170, partial [Staphylococcus capitis]